MRYHPDCIRWEREWEWSRRKRERTRWRKWKDRNLEQHGAEEPEATSGDPSCAKAKDRCWLESAREVSRFWMSQHFPGYFLHLKCASQPAGIRGSFKVHPNVSFSIKSVLILPTLSPGTQFASFINIMKFLMFNVTLVFSLALASLLSNLPLVPPPHLLYIIGFSSGASVYIFGVYIVSSTVSRKTCLCKLIWSPVTQWS